ncbi:MAG: hypothetical protein PWP22_1582 [Thermoanaerobacter sp.]|nr:hypothetical protein [Thermoanaerobacter sp.]
MRRYPTALELEAYLNQGYSLRKISQLTGVSVPTLSKLCDTYGIEKPRIGRPKGFKTDKETRDKISKKIKEWWEER